MTLIVSDTIMALSTKVFSVIMLKVVMLSVAMLIVVMLNVVAPSWRHLLIIRLAEFLLKPVSKQKLKQKRDWR